MTSTAGLVLEQTLGHVTHSMNLKRFLAPETGWNPQWFDVSFRPRGLPSRLPPFSLNWSLRGSLEARRLLNASAENLDVLFVHTMTIGLLAGSVYERVPTVISVDATPYNLDTVADGYAHRTLPQAVEKIKLNLTSRMLGKAQGYVAWCEWAKESLVHDYGVDAGKVLVVPPGADVGLFRREHGKRQSGLPRILFVGGDFERKGGDLLLEVFRSRLRGRAELHLVTGHPVEPEEGIFVYKGLTANSKPLVNLFKTADVFALPTRADCLAVVLGEAMAASLPIITTTVGGQPEAVAEGQTGYVIDPGSVEQLGDRLEHLIDDESLRISMGLAARTRAEEGYDAQRNALRVKELLQGLI